MKKIFILIPLLLCLFAGKSQASFCDSLSAYYTDSSNGSNTLFFFAEATDMYTMSYHWSFGDGTSASTVDPHHTYTADGTYIVTLTVEWINGMDTCIHSVTDSVTVGAVTPPVSALSGNIYGLLTEDSASYLVWLIVHDSVSNTLTAIDSTYSTLTASGYRYEFQNVATGTYLTKAKSLSSVAGTSGLVPTYDTGSTYWANATEHYHQAGITDGHLNIHMEYGTVPSGPGFIGGSIALGAGKGTSTGIANVQIFLRDNSSNILTYTYTDANGAYSFSNLAAGTYSVYPEAINYNTTPYNAISITANAPSATSINFEQHNAAGTITPVTESITNVTASKDVKIFPNPAKGIVHITGTTANAISSITISDVVGHKVIDRAIANPLQNDINISGLSKGIYIIHTATTLGERTQKLVIE